MSLVTNSKRIIVLIIIFARIKVVLHTKRNRSNLTEMQDDTEAKVSMSGGHCERNVYMNICLILNGNRDRSVRIYKSKLIVNGNEEREIAYS